MSAPGSGCGLVIMPRPTGAWPTARALWITADGWAGAMAERFGAAWVVTPDGIWSAGEVPVPERPARRRRALPIPDVVRTLTKDLRLSCRQADFRVPRDGPWRDCRVEIVWEHHDLFNRAGGALAAAVGAPLVRYVHAPQVWEARQWGVRRPVWGRALERLEAGHLRSADLVACVSSTVAGRLRHMGVDPDRIVVSPMAVDAAAFSPEGPSRRTELGIPPSAVVFGWCGSFRPFHGLDRLVEAFALASRETPELHLLLVGGGASRESLERTVREAGLGGRVTFAGPIDHAEMPEYLRAFDVGVVSSDGRGPFHYSPLKLREYAACGLPTVAPAAGELLELRDLPFLTLYQAGDPRSLAAALSEVAAEAGTGAGRGQAARSHAEEHWTWRAQLDRTLSRLAEPPTQTGREAAPRP